MILPSPEVYFLGRLLAQLTYSYTNSCLADLHNVAVCVTGRKYSEIGGTPFSPSYTWSKDYEILPSETKCACDLYRQRNTGDKQWDKCPDCTFVSYTPRLS